ncbi:MAG: hypothetical protein E7556_00630 [Ruminococcaceae bacterium]|nr:hypothetical protein [Oscillospiraceae bacterium]
MAKNERIIKAKVSAKRIINYNRIFMFMQVLFIMLSLLFNFVLDDSAVAFMFFFHAALFIFYNIYTGHIGDKYFDAVDKYHSVYDEIHHSRHLKLTIKLYKLAKENNDNIMKKLIEQKAIKLVIWIVHFIATLLLVPVE